MYHVQESAYFPVSKEVLWSVYTDHARWKEWTFMATTFLEKEGSPDKNGVGAIRVFGAGKQFSAYEEITLFEPCERMEYKVIKGGLPFKNHHGVVIFEEEGEGTRIRWSCSFEARIWGTGPMMKFITQKVFRSSLDGLKKFPFDSAATV